MGSRWLVPLHGHHRRLHRCRATVSVHCLTLAAYCSSTALCSAPKEDLQQIHISMCGRSVCETTFDDDDDRAKHLLAPDAHAPCHAGDHSGWVELPAAVVCQLTTDKHLAGGTVQYM